MGVRIEITHAGSKTNINIKSLETPMEGNMFGNIKAAMAKATEDHNPR
jgi:hypothetical protein